MLLYQTMIKLLHSFFNFLSVSDEEALPRGITFNNDGSKMYIVGWDGDDVNEYNLSTNFDVSTASFVDSYSFMTPTQKSNLENKPTECEI